MKLKYLTLTALCSIISISFAVPVIIPPAKIIKSRLRELGLDLFAEKTHIARYIANQEIETMNVFTIVETFIHAYNQYMRNDMVALQMELRKPLILEALLRDTPEALRELEMLGLYDSIE